MIYKILKDLESDNSRNFKIDYLQKHADNELLKRVVKLALDPFTQFYQRKIPAYTFKGGPSIHLGYALDELFKLSSRQLTGNAAIDFLSNLLGSLDGDDALVLERVIQKDLKCGVSDSTVNKVWPELIPEFPCMLASAYDEKLVSKINWPAMAQLKMDGMRFNAIVKDGTCEFRSRNGKEIQLLGNLEQEFITLAKGVDCVFDGELLVMLPGDYQFADRQTGNGILNKANKGTISEKEAKMVHATLWDVIPYEDFYKGICKVPYRTRFHTLTELISTIQPENKKIWLVSSDVVNNINEANAKFEEYLALGLEGIILKDMLGVWENKRAKHLIKFKGELECDLKIVEIQEGTGKYAGKIGALKCESADGIVKVDVGSGFKDNQRELTNDIIGKIVAVKYNARIKNKQGEESLFLPIFLEIREDKTEADHSKDIK
jgi:ATP-dependent DNA ligase